MEGFPSNMEINVDEINCELARRQKGYGRGKRMDIETDTAEILSGIRFGKTLGSPISIFIKNKDWENWKLNMSCENIYHDPGVAVKAPRPGHADLAGVIKYNQDDVRNILERASARETSTRTAAGALAKQLLKYFGIFIHNRVVSIGNIEDVTVSEKSENYWNKIKNSDVSMYDQEAEKKVRDLIDKSKAEGDTLGGIIEVSIHDEIYFDNGYYHKTNNAGGIEGGMSNGETIQFRAAVKPIPTLMKPLKTVDISTKEIIDASKERSDVCAVPAAGVVMENIAAWVIAKEMTEKFGGDSIEEMLLNYNNYIKYVQER
jgi:chorismate synthase